MHNQIHHIDIDQRQSDFEHEYLSLREKEGRLYSDQELAQLPLISKTHHLSKEWKIRAGSCTRLVNYLGKKNKLLRILEIGCGNGWLSIQLAGIRNSEVVGMDINKLELEQARRVFIQHNLCFVYDDIRHRHLQEKFDIIIFAASFQYFNPVGEILDTCIDYLNESGEIHILDTPFYDLNDRDNAKERSKSYFDFRESSAMIDYYFHHSMGNLAAYNYKVLHDPKSLYNKLFKINPFPWICITK